MKIMRNYIAHESKEAKNKYQKNVLGENADFKEPSIYLKEKNKKRSISNYSIYIEKIEDMIDIFLDPTDYK